MSNTYTYNKRRLLVSESQSQTAGSAVWSFGYTYNSNGHLASLVYPAGLTVDYLPNALGQPTKAGSFATDVTYHPSGAMKSFTYGNGLIHTMIQNTRQLPERSTDSGGVLDLVYAYDPNGNVASVTDQTVAARQTRSMRYDGRDRLLTTISPMYPGGATYAYDVLDNLSQVKVAGRDHRYQYDANNRLASATNGPGGPSVLSFGYDVRGNLNNKNGSPFVFDQGNRLRTAQGTHTYRYDAWGRRVRTASSAGMLYEMYSQDGKLLWQRDELINARFQYVYLNGSVVAVRKRPAWADTEELIYWHTDALGSQIAATVGTTVVQTTEHEPFGLMLNRSNNNRMGYSGHVMDQSTGLIYMQQRYYDPTIGRFLSVDPVSALDNGDMRHFNRYAYAYDNPYKFTDPDGRAGLLGFGIGVVLELGRQTVTGEIRDTSGKGVLGNVSKVLIAGAAGATGAGIASGVSKLTASVAVRAAANAGAGAAVGAASTAANNTVDGKNATDGMAKGALVGATFGAAGSVAGDAADALKSAANANARGASSSISLANRNLLDGVERTTQSGSRASSTTVGTGAVISNTVSNSSGAAQSCGAQKKC